MGSTALSWSGGKDGALALQALRAAGEEPAFLLTTVDEAAGIVPHHDVPIERIAWQAERVGLPLVTVDVPAGAPNAVYEARLRALFAAHPKIEGVAFGDLFLRDLRDYREAQMREVGLQAVFPLWGSDTSVLARRFIADGFEATIVAAADVELIGRAYDEALLAGLPGDVDPCGENGEFHTFVTAGPVFS